MSLYEAYAPVGWEDYPNKTTPITSQNLKKMDNQILANTQNIEAEAQKTEDLEVKVEELSSNLTASDELKFRFATDGEGNYGYLGADDSFIPFSNPYLRYDEDTGYIQALKDDGTWYNATYVGALPMGSIYLFSPNDMHESIMGTWSSASMNAAGNLYWKSGGAGNAWKYATHSNTVSTEGKKYLKIDYTIYINAYSYVQLYFGGKSQNIGSTGVKAKTYTGTCTLDVSTLTSGKVRLGIYSGTESSEYSTITIKNIYLTDEV